MADFAALARGIFCIDANYVGPRAQTACGKHRVGHYLAPGQGVDRRDARGFGRIRSRTGG